MVFLLEVVYCDMDGPTVNMRALKIILKALSIMNDDNFLGKLQALAVNRSVFNLYCVLTILILRLNLID